MRPGRWGGLVLAGAVLLAACSGDDAADEVTVAPETTSAPETTTAPETTAVPETTTAPETTAVPETTVAPEPEAAMRPSPGCGTAEAGPVDRVVEGSFAGSDGRYIEVLPGAHDGSTPVPLVVDLHGYSSPLEAQRLLSGLAEMGLQEGFGVVLPQVTRGVPSWNASVGSSDVQFVTAILDEVVATRCIDEARVYVAGMSNGAFMTSALACSLSDRVAAAAPVTGIADVAGCELSRPVPVIAFHGTADSFVSYDGGLGDSVSILPTEDGGTIGEIGEISGTGGPTIEDQTAAWAGRNSCSGSAPAEEQLADDVVLLTWDCPDEGPTLLYRIIGGGHTWPGSPFLEDFSDVVGPTTFSIDANELIWAFFQAHPLP